MKKLIIIFLICLLPLISIANEIKVIIPRHVVVCNSEKEAKRISNWLMLGSYRGVAMLIESGNGCFKDDNFYYLGRIVKTDYNNRLSYVKFIDHNHIKCGKAAIADKYSYGWVITKNLIFKHDLFELKDKNEE